MPVLYRASYGYLLRHPWQPTLALLGICMGVAVMVAVDIANKSSRSAFLLSMDAVNGKATHQIVGGPGGIDENAYVKLRKIDAIRAVAPVVEGFVSSGSLALKVVGVDPFAERGFRDYSTADAGTGKQSETGELKVRQLITETGALLLSPENAKSLGLKVGDRFEIVAEGKSYRAMLAGILPDESRFTNLAIADIATAQLWFNMRGRLSRIDVRSTAGDGVAASIRNRLPPGLQLLSAEARTRSVEEMSTAFMTNLTAMSFLAMLVGIFLIYNSVSFAVVQRRGLIGVLRALGLTGRQTFLVITSEGLALGLAGAVLGVLLGVLLGKELLFLVSRSINDLYFRLSVTAIDPSPVSIFRGFFAGLAATLLAAAIPAMEASSFAPRLALTRSNLEQQSHRLLPAMSVTGLSAILLSVLILRFWTNGLVSGLVALFLLISGFALCIPMVVNAVTALIAPLAGRLGGITARLTIAGIGASLSRTGVAIVSLAVAVSATVGVSVMVDSFRDAVSDWLKDTLQSDIYVAVPGGSIDPDLLSNVVHLPGVAGFTTRRRVWIEGATGRTRVIVSGMAEKRLPGTRLLDAEPGAVWPAFAKGSAILVSESYGYRNRVGRGDSVQLRTASGPKAFVIAATYRSYDASAAALLMSHNTYTRYWLDQAVDSIGLFLTDSVPASAVTKSIRAMSAGHQALLVRSNQQLRQRTLEIFDRTFTITDVLYWLALGVAFVGILGAMLAMQLERSREFGILRALGMTRRQLGRMVVLQCACIGLFSGLSALPLGLLMADVLVTVINQRAFGWQLNLSIHAGAVGSALLLAIGAALLAGLYPAWRAARALPALAMREE